MKRLFQIEWLKLKHYRPFWVLTGLYALLVTLICAGVHFFFIFLKNQGADFRGVDPTIIPFYDFPDIWQNITYIATFFKIFLAFIVIITTANEIINKTLRQNIIDGMGKKGWIQSKLLLIGGLSLAATLLLFFVGLISGLLLSHPHGYPHILASTSFLFAYFLEVFTFLTFALFLILLVRRSGLVIVGLMMYTFAFEPFLGVMLMFPPNEFNFPSYTYDLAQLMPIRALNNLIHVPYQKYAFREIQDFVSLKEVFIVCCWLSFYIGMSYLILKNRDL